MSATKLKHSDTPSLPAPVPRAWHVIMANGADQTVTAHACTIRRGVLVFQSPSPTDPQVLVLIRAFAKLAWQDVGLVNVPVGAALYPPPPSELVDLRHGWR